MANSVDPDETPHSAASHLGLNCLLRPVCPNTYGQYGISDLKGKYYQYLVNLTLKALRKIVLDDILKLILFFKENKD